MSILIYGAGRSGSTALFYALSRQFPKMEESFERYVEEPHGVLAKCGVNQTRIIERVMDFDYRIFLRRDPRDRVVSAFLYALGFHWAWDCSRRYLDAIGSVLISKVTAPGEIGFFEMWDAIAHYLPVKPEPVWHEDIRAARLHRLFGHQCFPLRFEDLITGKLDGLRKYLPIDGDLDLQLPGQHAHVYRTGTFGNWIRWFTEDDIPRMQELLAPAMAEFGYDWSDRPAIPPEESADAVLANFRHLVNRRRKEEGMKLWK